VTALSLAPSTVYTTTVLVCSADTVVDVDVGDGNFTYTYVWTVNGIVNFTQPTIVTNTLSGAAGHFERNDLVECQISASDGLDFGPLSAAVQVTVANSPPSVANVTLSVNDVETPTLLTCAAGPITDADGDVVTSFAYTWTVNSAVIANVAATYSGFALNGDIVECAVVASDGISPALSVSSNAVLLTAPRITSFAISDPDNLDGIYDNFDELRIEWNEATDMAGYAIGAVYVSSICFVLFVG
jgi:hypothetical protein